MLIRLFPLLLAMLALWLTSTGSALAWGPTVHDIVNTWAIYTLPPEIRPFFENNRQFLVEHANDPDEWIKKDRYERKRHYIYLDKYGVFPYPALPHVYQRAMEQFSSGRINRDGVLPWQIGDFSLRLTKAMKAGNWEEVKSDAAALAHYVADAHDPLHTTQNFDGQLTQQTGLADRFEIRLPDRYSKFFIMHPESAVKINDPTDFAFQTCVEANIWVDLVVWSDVHAREGLPDYTDEYFDRFYDQVGQTLVREINAAAHDAGSYLYTAWLNAGRPQLPAR
ncbi:MAG: hypothetical protein ABSF14_09725 [Terriglobia bacterium]|jgi:hypothetical protein